jgi:hypothetical protein
VFFFSNFLRPASALVLGWGAGAFKLLPVVLLYCIWPVPWFSARRLGSLNRFKNLSKIFALEVIRGVFDSCIAHGKNSDLSTFVFFFRVL